VGYYQPLNDIPTAYGRLSLFLQSNLNFSHKMNDDVLLIFVVLLALTLSLGCILLGLLLSILPLWTLIAFLLALLISWVYLT
jgi:hypothetical protein